MLRIFKALRAEICRSFAPGRGCEAGSETRYDSVRNEANSEPYQHMPSRPVAVKPKKSPLKPRQKTLVAPDLGPLPEWNLADLYSSIDAPEFKADLDRAEAECLAFEKAYKGRLEELAGTSHGGNRSPNRCGVMRRSRICSGGWSPTRV